MLQSKVLQFLGDTAHLDDILRAFTLYACRLCSSAGISALYRLDFSPTEREGLRGLKDWIDHNTYRNALYQALWTLAQQERPYFRAVAGRHGIDPIELRYLHRLLSFADRAELRKAPEPTAFSATEVMSVINSVRKTIRRVTYQKLRYCYENDHGLTKEDFQAELKCQALRVIRNYEVFGLSVQEMVPLVARGVTNHAKNLATYYGKERRNPLRQLEHRSTTRRVWYCNVTAEKVEHTAVSTDPRHRKQGGYVLAIFPDGKERYICPQRLYNTQVEAQAALYDYQHGGGHKRSVIVDLSGDCQDDWQPTVTSIDGPGGDEGVALLELLPAEESTSEAADIEALLETVNTQVTDPRARMFFSALLGDLGPLFENYCVQTTGRSQSELTPLALGRTARRYCNLTLQELTARIPR